MRNLVLLFASIAVWTCTAHAQTNVLGEQNGSGIGPVQGLQEIPGTAAGFEIDGNLLSNSGGIDWFGAAGGLGVIDPATCAGSPSQSPAFFGRDNEWRQGVDGKFKTRSNKNNDWIAANEKPWNWSTHGGNPQKNDITEIYAHARSDKSGDLWVILAAATRAPQGDNHTDFEFNQAGVTITGENDGNIIGLGPHHGRTIGDLLVSVDEVNGGRIPVPTVRRWNGTEFVLVPESEWSGKLFVANNSGSVTAPCGAVNQKGDKVNTYASHQFFEIAFNADLLLNPNFDDLCGSPATVMVKTRSSHSFTAELKDFALAGLGAEPAPACVITGPSTICPGSSIELCGPEGAGLTYLWSNGATTRCITVNAAGTYTLTITAPGCPPSTCTKTVTAGTAPVCSITGPSTLCPGSSIELCGPEGGGFTYQWSNGATTRCIIIIAPGTYTLTVSGGSCGTATCSKTVTGGTAPSCTITGPNTVCSGQTAELCGPEGAGLTYQWSTGATTRCITITAAGTYTLTVNGGPCGPATCSKTVTPATTPVCSISGPTTLCPGSTAELCGPEGAGLTYQWSTGATTRCITINAAGTYTLTVSGGSCGTASCTKTVTASTAPSCSISGPNTICPGQSIDLCGPEGTGLTYQWSTGATTRCITVSAGGKYTLTVSGGACGTATCSKMVLQSTAPVCSITGPNTLCLGQTAELCGPEGAGFTYQWSTGATTRCITVNAAGTFTLTVSSASCGTVTCSKTIKESLAPSCTIAGPNSLCPGQTAELCGPEGAGLTYSWNTGATTRCITITTGGTYTLTVNGGPCGPATCSKTVTLGTAPVCSIEGPTVVCPEGTAELCGPEGAGLTYSWSTGAITRCITITQPGTYTLTVTSAGCGTSTCSKTIKAAPPTACSISGPGTLCPNQTAELCGPEGAGLTYAWSTGATTRCITITTADTYTLTVTGGPCGPATCSKTVASVPGPVCSITGPNTVCPEQTIELCGPESAGGAVLTYLWSTGATTRCITVSQPDTYTLTVTAPGCGSSTCSKTIKLVDAPVCTITGSGSLCPGQTAELCGPEGAGLTYSWSTGATTRCITVTAPGTFTLTVSGLPCGTATCSKTVVPGTGVACTITGPNTICAGTPAELCGPEGPGLTYSWSTGATTRCISVTAQGIYSLDVSGNGCGPTTCVTEVTASSIPVCTITGPTTICTGQTAQLCGPEGFQGTVFSYLWSTGATTRCITIDGPGSFTLTVSTPDCGSLSCSTTVTKGSTIACSIIGPDDLDLGQSGELCGPEGVGLTYLWSTGATTRCITISAPGTYTLTVTSGTCGTSTCAKTVRDRATSSCRCSFGYPDNSNLPRSLQIFSGSQMVKAIVPGRDGCPIGDTKLKLFVNDDVPLALGIRRVVVYTSPTDSTITDYAVTPTPGAPACVTDPQFGATAQTGLQTGNDTAVGGGRPIWPVLYITDITVDKNARDGDWQQGSTMGIPADQVCGTWVTGVRRVYQHLGTVTVAMDPSPAQNHWNLGSGSDVPPGGFASYEDKGFGAEVSWDLTQLGLLPGHRYRIYTIVHNADQGGPNGGEAGHGCTRVVVSSKGAILTMSEQGDLEFDGGSKPVTSAALPARFELAQNAPNPFAAGSKTAIRFSLPEASQVRVAVYTVAGQRIGTLAEGTFEPGHRTVEWNGTDGNGRALAPGLYICKLEASAVKTGRFIQVRKMVMVK